MPHPPRSRLESFQRGCAIATVAAFAATLGVAALDADERSYGVAGGLILVTVLFTAYMQLRALNQRRRLRSLATVLAAIPPAESRPDAGP